MIKIQETRLGTATIFDMSNNLTRSRLCIVLVLHNPNSVIPEATASVGIRTYEYRNMHAVVHLKSTGTRTYLYILVH